MEESDLLDNVSTSRAYDGNTHVPHHQRENYMLGYPAASHESWLQIQDHSWQHIQQACQCVSGVQGQKEGEQEVELSHMGHGMGREPLGEPCGEDKLVEAAEDEEDEGEEARVEGVEAAVEYGKGIEGEMDEEVQVGKEVPVLLEEEIVGAAGETQTVAAAAYFLLVSVDYMP